MFDSIVWEPYVEPRYVTDLHSLWLDAMKTSFEGAGYQIEEIPGVANRACFAAIQGERAILFVFWFRERSGALRKKMKTYLGLFELMHTTYFRKIVKEEWCKKDRQIKDPIPMVLVTNLLLVPNPEHGELSENDRNAPFFKGFWDAAKALNIKLVFVR
ncbi:MAG: hypothetical protein A2667_02205 [Candidatus Wildermuthbacteria bacterium RIFCSPHIGHO2_01_FULL_47_27]|uniref:Uncharacterized protein n=2 Tax=Candidatus Wildermuthiibacteriota TaxID=1817923 RepID=A0A1G2RNP7_9BACT|nr:MAG: hypothetical protein UY15_C0003G0008 [Parcubacteria group bacterium GW2011_GWA2_47_9]OHA63501.1 MAG: hypothetical protein A2667_02205 [Candidatus Wildermuthbacteria bacterium RIFCSPHIGHO2_01_FULL_47_27]OHA67709.1 MAG: hypothetical protein A3D59_04730 [Candidatus Wildermuthbacteria bacterium RIFCSPHIGHO2_02_FULL_47_17]OHA73989.1 MAG: hypothetical protein A3A32_01105 [Candidatus Wildermuthbacteria bacterium RIFCSPLOWO2_01_FULL_48_35]OHA75590.1 MAG: hypothetical protein A3I38_03810 [Candid